MEDKIVNLFEKFVTRQATEGERDELFALLRSAEHDARFLKLLDQYYAEFNPQHNPLSEDEEAEILQIAFEAGKTYKVRSLWPRIAAAASILIAVSIGGYFTLHKKATQQTAQNHKQDILPGSNKAILTLANGKTIILSGASNGTLAKQGNILITKTANGKLNYKETDNAAAGPMINTLATQLGGETSLTLADGTEVKLDAGSSITYPVAFKGKDRRVSVTGQVYFKVKHNARQPFFVVANGQTIADIGTEFNINAYEATRTTLVEGAVTVNGTKIAPGQQATGAGQEINIASVNTDEVAGWARGVYQFNGQNIHSIMDQIKRWYNIDVQYAPNVTTEKFYATVSRNKNISQVFYNLSYTNKVHFKIEGRSVTVLP